MDSRIIRTQLSRREACVALGTLALGASTFALGGCSGSDQAQTQAEPAQNVAVVSEEQGQTGEAATVQADDQVPSGASPVASYGILRTEDERKANSNSVNDQVPGRHVVFLTFDDGPSTNTQRILDILASYGVKATWFVKGTCGHMDYLPTIWGEGHQVAIHTYTHEYEEIYASSDAYWYDLHLCGDAIAQQIGFAPTLVRFPGGSVNDYNYYVRDQIIADMHANGYHYFDWNISCGDGADHTADELYYYTTSEAIECNSCCVLMHDSAAKDTTVEALPSIIQFFIDNGFEFDVLLHDTFGYHF